MKKLLFGFISIFFIASACRANNNPCGHVNLEWFESHAGMPESAEIIYKKKIGTLCETVLMIQGDPVSFYCSKDFFIQGQMFKDKKSLTNETFKSIEPLILAKRKNYVESEVKRTEQRKLFFKKNIKELDSMVSFQFGAKNYNRVIYFITDPNCSHCKKMLKVLGELSIKKGFLVKTVIAPILGEKSLNLGYRAVCKNFGYNEYKNLKDDGNPYICEKAVLLFKREKEFFKRADLNFVPFIIDGKGKWVVEGGNPELLKKKLASD
ncbi:MAG: hypothetical protein CSB21_03285 [Deltaproteobacteria bacterium]|nr:MAG: hypothetical protein CSB21_03285 [Deltaproteobacteria bacterium]